MPLSKVRDFLSGSRGGPALSQQLDHELAQYIDPRKLAASRTRGSIGTVKTAQLFDDQEHPREKALTGISGPRNALSPAVLIERQQTEPEEQKVASPAGVRAPPGIRVAPTSFISLRNSDAEDEDGQLIRLDARRTLS